MKEETTTEREKVYLGLGSNQGDKLSMIKRAIEEICELPETQFIQRAGLYRSEPWGNEQQDWFVNTVIAISTGLSPFELLKRLKEIEHDLGRMLSDVKWGPRTIDIDILLFGRQVIDTPELKVPHPYLTARLFVLQPLLEIAPEAMLPTTGERLEGYLNDLQSQPRLQLLEK